MSANMKIDADEAWQQVAHAIEISDEVDADVEEAFQNLKTQPLEEAVPHIPVEFVVVHEF